MSSDTNTNADATIDNRDDIPDRDELVALRRDQGLTNEDIAENHVTEFSSRQIGIFCSMYGIQKGWKDEAYLREQIDAGVMPEELAAEWPVTTGTVESWMDRFDIEENPVPELFDTVIGNLDELQGAVDDDELQSKYEDLVGEISDDKTSYFET